MKIEKNWGKSVSFDEIYSPEQQSATEEEQLMVSLDDLSKQKHEYELLDDEKTNAENEEEYEKIIQKLTKMKNDLIEYSSYIQKEYFPEIKLKEIYTYDQIEEMKKKVREKIFRKKGIQPS